MADSTDPGLDPAEQAVATSTQQLADATDGLKTTLNVTAPNTTDSSGKPSFDFTTFITDAYSKISGEVSQAKGELQGLTNKFAGNTAQEQQAIEDASTAQRAANNELIGAQIQQKADVQKAAALYGTDPGNPSNTMVNAANEINSSLASMTARAADIRSRNSVGFLDDPFQFVVNQVVLPYEEKKQSAEQANVASLQGTIMKAQAMTLDSAKIAESTDAAASTRLLAAKNDEIVAAALQKKAEIGEKLDTFAQSNIQIRDALNKTVYDAAMQNTQLQITQHNAWIEEQKAGYYESYRQLMETDKQNKLAESKGFSDALGSINTTFGTNITPSSFKLLGTEQKEGLLKAIAFGGSGHIAGTPAEAIRFLNDFNIKQPVGMGVVRDKIQGYQTEAANIVAAQPQLYGSKPYMAMKPEEQQALMDKVIATHVGQELNNRTDTGGMFSPGSLYTTLPLIQKAAPGLAKALGPIHNSPGGNAAPTSAQLIYDTQKQRVLKGEISPAQAATEVSETYKAINADMWENRNLKLLNMPGQVAQKYNTKIQVAPGYLPGAHQSFDMMNQSQLNMLFTRQAIDPGKQDWLTGVP